MDPIASATPVSPRHDGPLATTDGGPSPDRGVRRAAGHCSRAGYAGIAVYSAHVLTSPSNRPIRLDPRRLGRVEPWSARTLDGLTIRGWYLPTAERRRLIVGVHGMGMNREELAGGRPSTSAVAASTCC